MCLSHAASGPAQAGAASAGRRSRRISANAHPAAQRLCASGPARPAPGGGRALREQLAAVAALPPGDCAETGGRVA